MLVLAIDTAGKHGGIALARAEAGACELLAEAALAGGSYSAQLVPQIAALLAQQEIALRDLDGFAVASGPGSFTGLRVGLAAVKALADVLGKPIAAVSVLEAVAAQIASIKDAPRAPRLIPVLDAGRGELYAAEYRVEGGQRELVRQAVIERAELSHFVAETPEPHAGALVLAPDSALVEAVVAAGGRALRVAMPGVAEIARLGAAKLLCGETTPAATLDADYIRRSDAELYSLPKLSG